MTPTPPLWLLLLLLLPPGLPAWTAFPRDPPPLLTSDLRGVPSLSWFRGAAGEPAARELGLDFQRLLRVNGSLLVAGRDHVFSFDLQRAQEGLVPDKYLTWKSRDVDNCAVRGRLRSECYNYIRVLLARDPGTLLACGTNALSPACRTYRMSTLEQEGPELSGQARCPYDTAQSSAALFADGSLYSATSADFQGSDAVLYRSLGPQPPLRSLKYDSKWLREPHFVHALEHRDHVYVFFREVSVESTRLGRVQFSRVGRVCKQDVGGSPRVLERYWTSFLKARLNCSIPGDSVFYFDVLQALSGPTLLHGRPALFGVFTTQPNSIPGSAVCAFYLDDIERAFEGRFKEQRSPDAAWNPVPEDRVPSPRPGSCAGTGSAAAFRSSKELPDDVLTFVKGHPLLDPAVPAAGLHPLFTWTGSRSRLTQVAVDPRAGPHGNTTVLFLGAEDGKVLKVLSIPGPNASATPVLVEEIDAYNPARCRGKPDPQRVLGLELDTAHYGLFVAFAGCLLRLPLGRCSAHGGCRRTCLASRDPYCAWLPSGECVASGGLQGVDFEQDVEGTSGELGACQDSALGSRSGPEDPVFGVRQEPSPPPPPGPLPVPLLLASVSAAFALGAAVSGLLVSCACRLVQRPVPKDPEAGGLPRALSLRSLARPLPPPPPGKEPTPVPTPPPPPPLYATFLPAPPGPDLSGLPTPDATPELPAKRLRAAPEWNQNGNNAGGGGRARSPRGPPLCARVLVRPPPPGCPAQGVEVTTLDELLRHLHASSPGPATPTAPFANRVRPLRPPAPEPLELPEAPGPASYFSASTLPRDLAPPRRLDIPPDGPGPAPAPRSRPPLSAPAPRLGLGDGRGGGAARGPRAPPALLTRVPRRWERKGTPSAKPSSPPKTPLDPLVSPGPPPTTGRFDF
ncbi:semaphorin-6C [Tachyglossus aculeatus]|uniref:semaphorin-6C n=1 Tax=Tachyglossus aculeatus TaxID=9261 RepID=UPI0018F66DCF|nr:semaphorin-6C [Tachyglossus aculeatus]